MFKFILSLFKNMNVSFPSSLSLRHKVPMTDLLSILREYKPEKDKFDEFRIQGTPTSDELQELVHLPYEVGITGFRDDLYLTTGQETFVKGGLEYQSRANRSKVSLHTHPIRVGEIPQPSVPSIGDLRLTEYANPSTVLSLVHPEGLMIYRKPRLNNSRTQDLKSEDIIRRVFSRLGYSMNLELGGNSSSSIFRGISRVKRFESLSLEEKIITIKKFLDETNSVVDEATWEDRVGIERVIGKIFSN